MTVSHHVRRLGVAGATLVTAAGLYLGGAAAATADAVPAAPPATVSAMDVTGAEQAAVDWASGQLGADEYYELCLGFVHDAYLNGAGLEVGTADSAIDWWNARPDQQVAGDTNPPTGAFVFWGPTDSNPYGHVAIAEGGDTVISSYEESTTTIHEFSIAARNAAGYPYLGWILPA